MGALTMPAPATVASLPSQNQRDTGVAREMGTATVGVQSAVAGSVDLRTERPWRKAGAEQRGPRRGQVGVGQLPRLPFQ